MIRERPGAGIHLVIEPFGTAHHPFRIHQLENPERSWEIFRKHRDEPLLKLWGYNIKAIRGQELKASAYRLIFENQAPFHGVVHFLCKFLSL